MSPSTLNGLGDPHLLFRQSLARPLSFVCTKACIFGDCYITASTPSIAQNLASAVIDSPSFPTVPTSSPSRPNPGPASPTTSRPTRRRSNITSQIYQFALGYPQTPPEISPELDPINSVQQTEAPFTSGIMASFLFKWYATTVSLDKLCPSQCPTVLPGMNSEDLACAH